MDLHQKYGKTVTDMRKPFTVALATLILAGSPLVGQAQNDMNLEQMSYALGVLFGNNLMQQGIDDVNATELARGLSDKIKGNPSMTPEEANALISEVMTARSEAKNAAYRDECIAFLERNKSQDGIQTTDSGLQYRHDVVGSGESPDASATVEVHYRGTLIDGTEFDSSYKRGETISFPLNGVIPGWTEGLQLMKEGGKTTFWIPQELAYGARPNPNSPIPPFAALIFEVELISIQ